MIIAHAGDKSGSRRVIMLGLSADNLAAIKAGKPLVVSEKTNAPKGSMPGGIEIMIFSGETENDMAKMFKGMVGPETKVHVDPRLGDPFGNAPKN